MSHYIFARVGLTLIFLVISDQWNLQGVLVGVLTSMLILSLFRNQFKLTRFDLHKLPLRFFWILVYIAGLIWSILRSTIRLSLIILSPDIQTKIQPSTLQVTTYNPKQSTILDAIASHGITITPGEMVIGMVALNTTDLTANNKAKQAYLVHTLYSEGALERTDREQNARAKIIQRIIS